MRVPARPLLLLLVCAGPAGAQAGARLSRHIGFFNPDWSPDGHSIVFESTLAGPYSVFVMNADGSALRRLTADTANNGQPRWSPDGKRIVFSSDRGGHGDIYLMNADGSGVVRVTSMPSGGYYQASFSPDGRWILFQGRPDNRETRERIYLVRPDGSGLRRLSDSLYSAEGPRWSPDGKHIRFLQVPYPRRFWEEMNPPDMAIARAGERMMQIQPDGAALLPLPGVRQGDSGPTWTRDGRLGFFRSSRDGAPAIYRMGPGAAVRRVADAGVVAHPDPSPDGTRFVYDKEVDGWSGIYVYDIASQSERLLAGGPGAGPLGYLRTAELVASSDTLDTYTSLKSGGSLERGLGSVVVNSLRRLSGNRWEAGSTWTDSTGTVTARQASRTAPGSLAEELETVRATTDSAALLAGPDRVTGWVVPVGGSAQLFDGPSSGERFNATVVVAAIAQSKPAPGQVFYATAGSLFGGSPLAVRVDSIRVVRRDTLYRGATPLPVLLLDRNGTLIWADETTGAEVAARGNAGPERWWWHVRRGVTPPSRP